MQASTLPAPITLPRVSACAPLLRLRSDEQLVVLFRAGSEEAFRTIHDRYRVRLFAYARQMLAGSRQDAEDALQDVFVRAYASLRAHDRPIILRAWLYRVAHNRCIDYLRRPQVDPGDLIDVSRTPQADPPEQSERREELRRLVRDVARLPEQQRSALLMRELQGLSYDELADALQVSIAAVKSLLVRARGGLVDAAAARDATCDSVRDELALACDRGLRASGLARRHLRDCADCTDYREELRGVRRRIAALVPFGPLGMLGHLLGVGGSATAASGAQATLGGSGALLTATKVALVAAAAAATAGSALEVTHRASAVRAAPRVMKSSADPRSVPLPGSRIPPPPGARTVAGTLLRRGTATAPLSAGVVARRHHLATGLSMGRQVGADLGTEGQPPPAGSVAPPTRTTSDSTASALPTRLGDSAATGPNAAGSSTSSPAPDLGPTGSAQPVTASGGSGSPPGGGQTPGASSGGPTATSASGTPPPPSR